jgi:hypothetical protein
LAEETSGLSWSKSGWFSNVLKSGEKPHSGISNSFFLFFGTTDSALLKNRLVGRVEKRILIENPGVQIILV